MDTVVVSVWATAAKALHITAATAINTAVNRRIAFIVHSPLQQGGPPAQAQRLSLPDSGRAMCVRTLCCRRDIHPQGNNGFHFTTAGHRKQGENFFHVKFFRLRKNHPDQASPAVFSISCR